MVNTQRIKDRIKETGKSGKIVAKDMNIAQPTLSQKINNIRPMTVDEAKVLANVLMINREEFGDYFFV